MEYCEYNDDDSTCCWRCKYATECEKYFAPVVKQLEKVYKGGHLKDRLKRLGKIVLGGVCLIVGVVVIVDVWYMWAIALGGALIGFSYAWLWVNCREEQ